VDKCIDLCSENSCPTNTLNYVYKCSDQCLQDTCVNGSNLTSSDPCLTCLENSAPATCQSCQNKDGCFNIAFDNIRGCRTCSYNIYFAMNKCVKRSQPRQILNCIGSNVYSHCKACVCWAVCKFGMRSVCACCRRGRCYSRSNLQHFPENRKGSQECLLMCSEVCTGLRSSGSKEGILISGGLIGYPRILKSVELFNINTKKSCILPELPLPRFAHTIEDKVICGGYGGEIHKTAFSNCLTLTDSGTWKVSHTLKVARHRHSSWKSEKGIILMGGYRNLKTTELLKPDGKSNFAFDLQHSAYGSCAIAFESNSVIVTGGIIQKSVTKYTMNSVRTTWKDLPDLMNDRAWHACGKYVDRNNNDVLLVTGGRMTKYDLLATTEILTIGTSSWRLAGSLPVAMTGLYHSAVSVDNSVL